MLDIDACHILLGRPWQFDLQAIHKGHDNTYKFNWMGKKIVLLSSTLDFKQRKETATPSKQLFSLISAKSFYRRMIYGMDFGG